ncbi:MAG: hypothetical protein EA382_09755 [Spirochaetaceae bacterium]|nr:MAG: hypothetical protein EA382_09755 [Spirochaetaceae bacterium]
MHRQTQPRYDWPTMRSSFAHPPMESRPRPLWFWNDTAITHDGIREQLRMCRDAGYGGVGILPFGYGLSPSYLSDDYFSRYETAVEYASELGMRLSLYDEFGFPSGSVGAPNSTMRGVFAERHPKLLLKRLDKYERMVSGPTCIVMVLPEAVHDRSAVQSIVAMNAVSRDLILLADSDRIVAPDDTLHLTCDRDSVTVAWDAPAGIWQLMVFCCVTDGEPLCDYLDPEAGRAFIALTHERYYARFASHFGTTIDSTFHDEPTLYRAQGRTWTTGFSQRFRMLHGFDPAPLYPALWYDIGPDTAAARACLLSTRTELYAGGFAGTIQRWADDHSIDAMGHQDQEEIENPSSVAGDLIACFRYQAIPGIDKIGGNRPAERFYKVISSAAYAYDRTVVMSETYGAMGDIDWSEIYRVALDQYTAGITMLIPHAVWYDDRNVVFRPELSPRSPIYADGLPAFNAFLSRLNLLLQNDGRHVADVAVLYPIDGLYAAHHFDGELGPYRGGVAVPESNYVEVGMLLSRTIGIDFRFVHPDTIDERGRISDGAVVVDGEPHAGRFSLLILPAMRAVRPSTVDAIDALLESGGRVIAVGQMPTDCARFDSATAPLRLKRLVDDHPNARHIEWPGAQGGPAAAERLVTAIEQALPNPDARITPSVGVGLIHKVYDSKHLFLIANLQDSDRRITLSLRDRLDLSLWDPHTAQIRDIDCTVGSDGRTRVDIELGANRGLFLVERQVTS